MDINLRVAVPRLFPEVNSRFEMIYFEAIANALDAQATEINIDIDFKDGEFEKFNIIDNGVGFNSDQYNRFSQLMESKDNAHKGQGRLVYLIYFKNIKVLSYFSEDNKCYERSFEFNFDFSKESSSLKEINKPNLGTKLSFIGKTKKIHTLAYLNANYIREQVFSEFLPCLFKLKQENRKILIKIKSRVNGSEEVACINIDDIPNFQSLEIDTSELSTQKSNLGLFKEPKSHLYYSLKTNKEGNENSYITTSFAIDNRAKRIDFIDKENYIPNVEAIFFLVSKHFEGCVDPTRQELTLKPKDLQHIKKVFRSYIKKILQENVPEHKEIVSSRKNFLTDRFPHLIGYIDESEIGFKSNKDVIQDAQNIFFREQREILEKETLDENDYEKALELSSKNLAEYILFRQLQISKLKSIESSDREKVMHDIISPMKKIYSACNNDHVFNNNAWILDDRFMTYIHASSDISLKKITKEFGEIFLQSSDSDTRPDYIMFFSNTLAHDQDKVDIVCFEFKRLGETLENKTKATTELTKYIKKLKSVCSNIQRVWLYALVDFDNELEEALDAQDFKMKFSTGGKIWYHYYENIDAELSFLDFNAVVSDAENRNKTFMDILRKGFSYQDDKSKSYS